MENRHADTENSVSLEEICPMLGRKSPLRQPALSVLRDPSAPIPEVRPFLRALMNRSRFRKKERAAAAWLIRHGNWFEDQRLTLSRELSKAVDRTMKSRKPGRVVLRWFLRGVCVMLPLAFTLIQQSSQRYASDEALLGGAIILVFSAILTILGTVISLPLSIWIDSRRARQLRPVIEALGHIGQPDSIASLARALVYLPRQEIPVATSALECVNARLHPDDYGTLPLHSVQTLCRALLQAPPQTMLVILQTLAVVGDDYAINTVEYLLTRPLRPEVQEAATNLLPILQQRALDNQASSLLLRASQVPPDSGQTLLRATTEPSPIDPSQLLRMVTTEASNEQNRLS